MGLKIADIGLPLGFIALSGGLYVKFGKNFLDKFLVKKGWKEGNRIFLIRTLGGASLAVGALVGCVLSHCLRNTLLSSNEKTILKMREDLWKYVDNRIKESK